MAKPHHSSKQPRSSGRFATAAPAALSPEAQKASEASVKPMKEFTTALKGFTQNVGSHGIGAIKAAASGVGSGALSAGKSVAGTINKRREQAGLTSESMIQAGLGESPLLAAMAGGGVDILKSGLGGMGSLLGKGGKGIGSLLGFGDEKEKEKKVKGEGGEESEAEEQTAENTEKIAELLEEGGAEEIEKDRENKKFWEKLFGESKSDDDSGVEKVGSGGMGLMGAKLIGAALLAGVAAWLTLEGDFNNVFSGWTAALRKVSGKLTTIVDDVGKGLSKLTNNIAKHLDDFGKGVAKKFTEWKSKLFGPDGAKPPKPPKPGKLPKGKLPQAATLLDDIIPTQAVANVGDDVVRVADNAAANIGKVGKAARVLNRVALPMAIAVDTIFAAKDIYAADALKEAGTITEEQMADYAIERTSGAAGSIAGGLTGAAVGALAMSWIPVVGTLFGGVAGAMLGEEGLTRLAEKYTGGSGVDEVLEAAKESGNDAGWFGWGGSDDSDGLELTPTPASGTRSGLNALALETLAQENSGSTIIYNNNTTNNTGGGGGGSIPIPIPLDLGTDPSLAAPAQ